MVLSVCFEPCFRENQILLSEFVSRLLLGCVCQISLSSLDHYQPTRIRCKRKEEAVMTLCGQLHEMANTNVHAYVCKLLCHIQSHGDGWVNQKRRNYKDFLWTASSDAKNVNSFVINSGEVTSYELTLLREIFFIQIEKKGRFVTS